MSVIKAGGETYFLHFGLGALREIERETQQPIATFDFANLSAVNLTAVLRAALVKNHGRKDDAAIDAIADEVGLRGLMKAVESAIRESGLTAEEAEGNAGTAGDR